MENDEPLLLPQQAESLHPPADLSQVARVLGQALTQLNEGLTLLFRQIGQALAPVIKQVAAAAEHVLDVTMQAYIDDGAIYGPTSEGMLRWLKEKGEVLRLRMEAERIEQHQEAIRDFKRMLAEKRGET